FVSSRVRSSTFRLRNRRTQKNVSAPSSATAHQNVSGGACPTRSKRNLTPRQTKRQSPPHPKRQLPNINNQSRSPHRAHQTPNPRFPKIPTHHPPHTYI